MDDFEEIPVETVEGSGRQSPLAERLAVLLAGLVLLGGLIIAGANLLGSMRPD